MLLVEGVTVVVKFQDIGEDGEAGLQLGRRFPDGVPVIDAFQDRVADFSAGDPSGEAPDGPRCTVTNMRSRYGWPHLTPIICCCTQL